MLPSYPLPTQKRKLLNSPYLMVSFREDRKKRIVDYLPIRKIAGVASSTLETEGTEYGFCKLLLKNNVLEIPQLKWVKKYIEHAPITTTDEST